MVADIKDARGGVKTSLVWDFNRKFQKHDEIERNFDNAFCIEVTDHFWDPVTAFQNVNFLLKPGGKFFISSNFLFPHHTGFDCTRYTSTGLQKILNETGFVVDNILARRAVDDMLESAMRKESKVVYHPGEIGYMVEAHKNGSL